MWISRIAESWTGYNEAMSIAMRAALLGGLLALPLLTFAAEFKAGDAPTFASNQSISDDLYMAGGTISSAGTVQGDLILGGGTIMVSGPVSGDLIVGGGNVTVTSAIADDVRAGGGNISIQGTVGGDVVAGGGQIHVAGGGVKGDAVVAGGVITIDAPVQGDVKIAGADVRINAAITGNVEVEADEFVLGPNAQIQGNVKYSAPRQMVLEDGATVAGTTEYTERAAVKEGARAGFATMISLWLIAKLFMSLAGALLLSIVFSRFTREVVTTATSQPLTEMARGFAIIVLLPIASGILLASVIGIPLGILGLLSYGALLITASFVAPIILGAIVYRAIWKPAGYVVDWKTVLLGVALYFVLGLIPFIGWVAKFGILILALGAMLSIKWKVLQEWQ